MQHLLAVLKMSLYLLPFPHMTSAQVCKYIDIPLQHINNMVLLGMNRPPQTHTVNLLKKLRERIPDLVLRTTFICGFPGETQAQHRELVDFCKVLCVFVLPWLLKALLFLRTTEN